VGARYHGNRLTLFSNSFRPACNHGTFGSSRGKLQYDKDGPGGAAPVLIAKLTGAPEVSAADILVM